MITIEENAFSILERRLNRIESLLININEKELANTTFTPQIRPGNKFSGKKVTANNSQGVRCISKLTNKNGGING